MTSGNVFPEITKLQNKLLVPYNVFEVFDEDSNKMYNYELLKLEITITPSLDDYKKIVCANLEKDVQNFIYLHYPIGTQSTLQSFSIKGMRTGNSDVVSECEKIFNWIEVILEYYNNKKNSILVASSENGVASVNWNFKNDVIKPTNLKGWREIKAML